MKILLVDDHALFREYLAGLIRTQPDFDVVGDVCTVREAVDTASARKPDITLMDYELPDGTGVDAACQILKDSPGAKVVFLTENVSDEYLFSAIRCGAKGFFRKNTSMAKLLEALRAINQGEAVLPGEFINRILEEFSHWRLPPAREDALENLTFREIEILQHLSTGATNREIAGRLVITENTVKNHVHNILEKLELRNRREVVYFARQHGLINQEALVGVSR